MVQSVFKLNPRSNLPKYEQIVRCITDAIVAKKLVRNAVLPSIKQLSSVLNVSCATAAKAYDELKRRGIIQSTPYKGFHVASESIDHTRRIFLLFDEINMFKEDLYNAFKQRLAHKAVIDIFFHHYNIEVFKTLVLDNIGRFSDYVIMPFYHPQVAEVLEALDPQKVLLLDQPGYVKDSYPFVGQDFENDVYDSLKKHNSRIKKYKKFVLVYPEPNIHPKDIIRGFERYCRDFDIDGSVVASLSEVDIQAGIAYLIIADVLLVELIKLCRQKGLAVGSDVGIISYNDTPLKEILDGGIATISTDFRQMGTNAAEQILTGRKEQVNNPAKLIVRQSL
jgi:DNA-binding transcriptional regulator YhcF (GntR family)